MHRNTHPFILSGGASGGEDSGSHGGGGAHLAALAAATLGAMTSVIVRKIGHDERSVVLMLYPMVASFMVMAFALPFVYIPVPIEHFGLMGAMALLGLLGTWFQNQKLGAWLTGLVTLTFMALVAFWALPSTEALVFGILVSTKFKRCFSSVGVFTISFKPASSQATFSAVPYILFTM